MCLWVNTEMLRRDFKPFSMYGCATSFHFMAITPHHRQDAQVPTDMCQVAGHSSDTILDRVRPATSLCFQQRLLTDEDTFKFSLVYIYMEIYILYLGFHSSLTAAVQLQEFPDTFSWIFILLFSPWISTLLSFISLTGTAVCIDVVKTSQIHLFWQALKLQLRESSR